jgi:hypothetical protein
MSAVHKPNMNFDNETMVHVPYKVILQGTFQSAYDRFRRPKSATAVKKVKTKKESDIQKDTTAYNKWFK